MNYNVFHSGWWEEQVFLAMCECWLLLPFSFSGGLSLAWVVAPRASTDLVRSHTQGGPLKISGVLCAALSYLVLCPVNLSCLVFPGLLGSVTLTDFHLCLGFSLSAVAYRLHSASWGKHRAYFVCFSSIWVTLCCCLMSSVLQPFVSYMLFLYVHFRQEGKSNPYYYILIRSGRVWALSASFWKRTKLMSSITVNSGGKRTSLVSI